MKDIVRKVVLVLLMLVAFTACGTAVLWIFDRLMNTTTDNLLFAGFKVGFTSLMILGADKWLSSRKKAKSE